MPPDSNSEHSPTPCILAQPTNVQFAPVGKPKPTTGYARSMNTKTDADLQDRTPGVENRSRTTEAATAESLGEDTPVQYYSRSELPQREVALHRFSPKRKSTLIAISLLTALALTVATTVINVRTLNDMQTRPGEPRQAYESRMERLADSATTKGILMATGTAAALLVIIFIMLRAGPRIVALEFWIRRMGAGDLSHSVTPRGNDEITELAYDLEVLRRQSVRAQRLDLVQELSDDLQGKNQELEQVLEALHTTQDQVVSRQKLAELGELTAGVAHEIRNPLNLIQNFARTSTEMMTELQETVTELEGPPNEEQKALLEELTGELSGNMARIRQHGDRADRIVQDMLAMGRASQGHYQTVNLNHLVEDHAMLAYHSARSRDSEFNMKIITEYDVNAGDVHVVSEDIGRVILNLVSNACYATAERNAAEKGHEPAMWLTTTRVGDTVEIRVRDNGMGMPEEVMEKIFNPFFTTKPTDRGTGLGLSLSNDIVREHGGSITPESAPGKYAQMTVRIPAAPQGRDGA